MKLLILSDLHLEFPGNSKPIKEALSSISDDAFDVVVLAGDISLGSQGITWARRRFAGKQIIYVPGNHEYYHGNYSLLKEEFKVWDNIHILNPGTIEIDGVTFIGATLWSDCTLRGYLPTSPFAIQKMITDFRIINYDDKELFTVNRMTEIYNEERDFIRDELDDAGDSPKVVITHFLPSQECCAPQFVNDPYTPYFISDNDELVSQADHWIMGHTHARFVKEHSSGTKMYCNPYGYPNENKEPYVPLIVEI